MLIVHQGMVLLKAVFQHLPAGASAVETCRVSAGICTVMLYFDSLAWLVVAATARVNVLSGSTPLQSLV